jgi:hypothetical protein
MNDTTATSKRIVSDAGVSPQPSIGDHETATASDSCVKRLLDDVARPFGRRGPSRSWLPGIWGDPF